MPPPPPNKKLAVVACMDARVNVERILGLDDGDAHIVRNAGALVTDDVKRSLEEAAVAMVRGGFRHLVVTDGGEVAGLLSMRDVVRCWTDDGAICDVPASAGMDAAARP